MVKKNIKIIIAFIIGIILSGTISVYALYIHARDVSFTPTNKEFNVGNVNDALDELYKKIDEEKNSEKFCKLISGNSESIGSKYECDPGDGTKRNFYVLTVNNNNTVDLIMEKNISDTVGTKWAMSWYDAMKYFKTGAGVEIKKAWTNILDIDLPKAQAIVEATGSSWFPSDSESIWWCFGSKTQDLNSYPWCNAEINQSYAWLFNYTYNCGQGGCTEDGGTLVGGYWTRDLITNSNQAWATMNYGAIESQPIYLPESHGIRPVITVLKSNLYS